MPERGASGRGRSRNEERGACDRTAPLLPGHGVPRARIWSTCGAAAVTAFAACDIREGEQSALAPSPGVSVPTTLPARALLVVSSIRPTISGAAPRRARRAAHTAAVATAAIPSQAAAMASARGASHWPAAAIPSATPALASSVAPARRARAAARAAAGVARSRSPDRAHRICEEIDAHAQRRLVELRGIVVHFGVFPPVAQIRLIRIVYGEPVPQKMPNP